MKDTYCINDNKNTYGKQEESGGEQAGPFTDRAIPHNSKCRSGGCGTQNYAVLPCTYFCFYYIIVPAKMKHLTPDEQTYLRFV
ncbi:MAG: hypothetical protein WAX56_04450 [Gemmiger qucibialis]